MPKSKRKRAESSSSEETSEQGRGGETGEILNVEFEAFPLIDQDKIGISRLLQQVSAIFECFLRAKVSTDDVADQLIAQQPLGCIYKQTLSDDADEDDDDDGVYGCVSVLPLIGENATSNSIIDHIRKRADKNASNDVKQKLNSRYLKPAENRRVGFLVNERFLNLPPQIAPPSFDSLRKDMKRMGKEFACTHFLMIVKLHKPQETQQNKKKKTAAASSESKTEPDACVFANAEEQFLSEYADLSFDWCVSGELPDSETAVTDEAERTDDDDEDARLRPYRRVVAFDVDAFNKFIDRIQNEYSS